MVSHWTQNKVPASQPNLKSQGLALAASPNSSFMVLLLTHCSWAISALFSLPLNKPGSCPRAFRPDVPSLFTPGAQHDYLLFITWVWMKCHFLREDFWPFNLKNSMLRPPTSLSPTLECVLFFLYQTSVSEMISFIHSFVIYLPDYNIHFMRAGTLPSLSSALFLYA